MSKPPGERRKTNRARIIATIGPACDDPRVLRQLADAGMSLARLNFSHGNHSQHRRRIDKIRRLGLDRNSKVQILQDLEGYRIRIGNMNSRRLPLKRGQKLVLTRNPGPAGPGQAPLAYQGDFRDIRKGCVIFVDDGKIELIVRKAENERLETNVSMPGVLKERKGVNIQGFEIPFHGLTQKDKTDVQFGLAQGIGWIAQSFVRTAQDMRCLREFVIRKNPNCKLIAKIENPQGIRHIDEIIDVSDGVMVARGDMGVSVPIHKIPMIQKMIIKKCNQKGKFVITATQMLESMIENHRPTRAEVTDVANAIIDGSDFLMLSGETAAGKYPVEAVRMMREIIQFTEKSIRKI